MIQKQKDELIKSIQDDFQLRVRERATLDNKWLLNINFLLGNQYLDSMPNGDLVESGKQYYWQDKEVYNHIAPLFDIRMSKLSRAQTGVHIRPASSDERDIKIAKLSTRIIEVTKSENDFEKLQSVANYWSESTGSVFYKIVWDTKHDKNVTHVGKNVKISVCSPFEIFPDRLNASSLEELNSLLHVKVYPREQVEEKYNVKLEDDIASYVDIDKINRKVGVETKEGYTTVIEKYIRASTEYPNGRLIIIAGDKILFCGDLPYINEDGGNRGFPFARQVAYEQPSAFFGNCTIDRLIPIQRAFNAVKNRKHEFMARFASGVYAVEEGAVDIDSLEEEGIAPGRIITYRQGSTPPLLINTSNVPSDFRDEEDRLLSEFTMISGVTDFLTKFSANNTLSGFALSLLLEQEETKLAVTTDSIRHAIREIAKQTLRLFKQFATEKRVLKIFGDNGELETMSFFGSELNSDDIILANDNELKESPAARKNMVVEMLKLGLMQDENGRISDRNRAKIFEIMGLGNWESARSSDDIHIKRANIENNDTKKIELLEIDNHAIHIEEHSLYVVSNKYMSEKEREKLIVHIKEHKRIRDLEQKILAIQGEEYGK